MPPQQAPARSAAVDEAIARAKTFLLPAIPKKNIEINGLSAAGKISEALGKDQSDEELRVTFLEALQLLEAIHQALQIEQNNNQPSEAAVLDTGLISVVYGLLDLLLIEGIYPALSPGVGIPSERQKRSLLSNRTSSNIKDVGVLIPILDTLNRLAFQENHGIQHYLQDRILIDLISANTDLAFSPIRHLPTRLTALHDFRHIFQSVPISQLYPALAVLANPTAPEWFQNQISEQLSLLPLRPNGVRHTIEFIAASYNIPGPSDEQEDSTRSKGSSLSPEALAHASKLLSSVPHSMNSEMYFTKIAPQLLSMLDGNDGPEISKTAAYIISFGILSKRAIGSPGTVGWKLFAEPLLKSLNPYVDDGKDRKPTSSVPGSPITSESELKVALARLTALVNSYPNPGLTGRLLRPLLLPLWGLASYSRPGAYTSYWTSIATGLLSTFLKRCGNLEHLNIITTSLVWDGTSKWIFSPGSEGGLEIRKRDHFAAQDTNIIEMIPKIDSRISTFVRLLQTGCCDDVTIGLLFLSSSKNWLLPRETDPQIKIETLSNDQTKEPIMDLIYAKLVQTLLSTFGDKISNNPQQILELVQQLLQQNVERVKLREMRKQNLDRVTLSSLSDITSSDLNTKHQEDLDLQEATSSDDLIATAVSLLNAITTSPGFSRHGKTLTTLRDTLQTLQALSGLPSQFSATTSSSIQTSMNILQSLLSAQPSKTGSGTATQISSQEILSHTTSDLASDLAPVRTSAIQALRNLIVTDVQLDVPTIATLLLNTVRTDVDEYVHLAAISALVKLATARDFGFVARLVADSFQDIQERTGLEGRLRVGEALAGLVEAITTNDINSHIDSTQRIPILRLLTEITTTVAGRRGKRTREMQERTTRARIERIKNRQAEKAWGGEIPDLYPAEQESTEVRDREAEEKERRETEAIEKIVKGWEDTGIEEDVRLRTSALSVLGQILEHGLADLTTTLVNSAADASLLIISFEPGSGKAILRRAAVLVFMALLRAMDSAFENDRGLPSGLEGHKWMDVEKVLSWVRDLEDDDLVRGHGVTVLEGLEAWRMKRMMTTQANLSSTEAGLGLERLQGLTVDVDGHERKRPKIQEID